MQSIVEIRTYTLQSGTRDGFHKAMKEEAFPLLTKWGFTVLSYGPSLHDHDSYHLIRLFENLDHRQRLEDAFYSSPEWKEGPREAIVSKIVHYSEGVFSLAELTSIVENASANNDH